MPAIATSTISLIGGSVILTGALLTVIGYSEHYKDEDRGETTRAVGALVASLGAAVSFLASAVHLSGDTVTTKSCYRQQQLSPH